MMRILYLGFSSSRELKFSGATHAGVALSNFTVEILRERFVIDYFSCHDSSAISKVSGGVNYFLLRSKLPHYLFDLFKFFFKNNCFFNKKYDRIIAYHSYIYSPVLILLRCLGCRYILQVNEIFYRAGTHQNLIFKILESIVIRFASGYIISTDELRNFLKINEDDKKVICVIPGVVRLPQLTASSNTTNRLKLVYAGVIDKVKNGGAFIAINLAEKLDDENITIDIYGFGTDADLKDFMLRMSQCNNISKTQIDYKGSVSSDQIIHILKDYDVGLATQYIGTEFSASSFPSKILTYLGAGLFVISATSSALVQWKYKHLISLYKNEDLSDLISEVQNLRNRNKSNLHEGVKLIRNEIINDLEANLK